MVFAGEGRYFLNSVRGIQCLCVNSSDVRLLGSLCRCVVFFLVLCIIPYANTPEESDLTRLLF